MSDSPQNTSVQYLKGVGPARAKAFAKAGILTIEDLLYYFPRRYEDRTNLATISQLKEGELQTVKAKVVVASHRTSWKRRGFSILEVTFQDDTGILRCVWFNQPYLKDYFKPQETFILYGKPETYGTRLQFTNPEFESVTADDDSIHWGRIVPIYCLPQGFSQRHFRELVKRSLDEYLPKTNDFLSYDIRAKNNLLNLAQALINIHFPKGNEEQKEAYRRLAFEEFLIFQLPLALRKARKRQKQGIAHTAQGELMGDYLATLPFKLTDGQKGALDEIVADMRKPFLMQRLLQGDVGCGKTVVASAAALLAIEGGYQAAFMVPTEILAKQHFNKISSQAKKIKIALLTSGSTKKEKDKTYKNIAEGKINLIIGTHALLEEGVKFENLGLVVIDEQHKFGVGQRSLLPQKGINPDLLIMTATPIPRTLAITLYGDLDISVIRELPPGRQPVKTLHFSQEKRKDAYLLAKNELNYGRQVFIIYPVIEESFALDIAGAKKMFTQLKENEFRNYKLGLVHGKLKEAEQDKVMDKFRNKELDLLVATTVLEVGVDVPNATCMIIEHAERFGLSQLHQLRGRIGRGAWQSTCVLVSDASTPESGRRLEAMVTYSDGFKIAEQDLKIRGPGEFFGRKQHGLTELRIADPLTQLQLLKKAREEAIKIVAADQNLSQRTNVLLKQKLLHRFPEYEKLILVG